MNDWLLPVCGYIYFLRDECFDSGRRCVSAALLLLVLFFQVNVRAPFIMAQECAKRMIARGQGGKIVSTSSTASLFALHDHAAYCTSKAAINGLNKVRRSYRSLNGSCRGI